MTNRNDINKFLSVHPSIHDTLLTDSDAPQIGCSLELSCSRGTRAAHERVNAFENARSNWRVKRLKLFARRARKDDSEFSHALCAWF